jgi:hypothetical protein
VRTTDTLPLLRAATPARPLDALTVRALRLALRLHVPPEEAARQLADAAGRDPRIIDAGLARAERVLADEWSSVGARVVAELRLARDRLDRR